MEFPFINFGKQTSKSSNENTDKPDKNGHDRDVRDDDDSVIYSIEDDENGKGSFANSNDTDQETSGQSESMSTAETLHFPPNQYDTAFYNDRSDSISEIGENKKDNDVLINKINELNSISKLIMTRQQNLFTIIKENEKSNKDIIAYLNNLNDTEKVLLSQEKTIKKLHDSLLKYNDDVIYKTQRNLIMELIDVADRIRMIIEDSENVENYDILSAVKDLEKSVHASLSNNSVRCFTESAEDPKQLNRRRQQVVDTERTSDPLLDGVYKSVAPGYEWSIPYLVINSEVKLNKILEENRMPQMFSFIVRPEEVVKIKYCPEDKSL